MLQGMPLPPEILATLAHSTTFVPGKFLLDIPEETMIYLFGHRLCYIDKM